MKLTYEDALKMGLIGKKAYVKRGMYSHVIGIIEKSDNGITELVINSKVMGKIAFVRLTQIELVD